MTTVEALALICFTSYKFSFKNMSIILPHEVGKFCLEATCPYMCSDEFSVHVMGTNKLREGPDTRINLSVLMEQWTEAHRMCEVKHSAPLVLVPQAAPEGGELDTRGTSYNCGPAGAWPRLAGLRAAQCGELKWVSGKHQTALRGAVSAGCEV